MATLQMIRDYCEVHYRELYDAAYDAIANKKLADEITNKAVEQACHQRQEIVPDEKLGPFLHTTIRELADAENAKEQARLQKIDQLVFVEPKTAECSFDRGKITAEVLRAAEEEINSLKPLYKQVFDLYILKVPTMQIANIVHRKRQTVRNIKGKVIRLVQQAICKKGLL